MHVLLDSIFLMRSHFCSSFLALWLSAWRAMADSAYWRAVAGAAASDVVADGAVAGADSKGDLDEFIEAQRRKGGQAQALWKGYKGGGGRPASDGFKGLGKQGWKCGAGKGPGKQGVYYGAGFVDGYLCAMQESSFRDVERSAFGKNQGKGKRSPSRSRRTSDTGKGVGNRDIGGASYQRAPSFIDTGKGVGNLDIGGASHEREPSSIDTGKGVGGASYQREPSLAALPSSSSNAHLRPPPEEPPAMRAIIVPAKAYLISAEISVGNVRTRRGTPTRRRSKEDEVVELVFPESSRS